MEKLEQTKKLIFTQKRYPSSIEAFFSNGQETQSAGVKIMKNGQFLNITAYYPGFNNSLIEIASLPLVGLEEVIIEVIDEDVVLIKIPWPSDDYLEIVLYTRKINEYWEVFVSQLLGTDEVGQGYYRLYLEGRLCIGKINI